MSKDKKQNNFKFNTWWVYGSLIGIFVIIQLFSGSIEQQMVSQQHLTNSLFS